VTSGAREMALALLASRSPDATVCPSEIARAIAPGADWRSAMPVVHCAIDDLVDEEAVRLSWKGHALAKRIGPYRIGRGCRGPVCQGAGRFRVNMNLGSATSVHLSGAENNQTIIAQTVRMEVEQRDATDEMPSARVGLSYLMNGSTAPLF
jgi:hypothetical protein